MAELAYPTFAGKSPLHQRILAKLQAQVSWKDETSEEKFSVLGTTENVGETSALINLDLLPKVGSRVRLRLMDEDKTIIETLAQVIRVERDPSKPQAALSIADNLKKWKELALTAAQDWVTRDIKINYEDDGWLN
jgi:hypothetical protein